MNQQQEVEKQPKRTIVLEKDWFHATKPNPKIRKYSSIPGSEKEEHDDYEAFLYDPSINGRCCVGVYLKACGVSDDMLRVQGSAANVSGPLPDEALWLLLVDDSLPSEDAYKLYSANDGRNFDKNQNPEEFKENQRAIIRDTFTKHNVEVIFED